MSFFSLLFAASFSHAATIQQVLPSENRAAVVLEAEEKLAAGDALLATHDARNCSIKVLSVNGNVALVDISRCQFKADLKIGDKVERSLIPIEETKEAAPAVAPKPVVKEESPNDRRYRYGGIVYYSAADTIKFDSVNVTTNSGAGSGRIDVKGSGALGIGASFAELDRQSWGYIASFQYEFARKLNSVTITGPNGTAVGTYANSPKLSFLFVEGNMVYRWDRFYLPFGFNYSIPDITNITPGSRFSYSGGLGANISFGFFTTENLAFEFWSRALALQATEASGTTSIDYGTGFLTGLGFGLKYWY